jgi:dTMP kinase
LIAARAAASHQAKDIHEQDNKYLEDCHRAYCELAEKYGWAAIKCSQGGVLLSIEQIHEAVYQQVAAVIR